MPPHEAQYPSLLQISPTYNSHNGEGLALRYRANYYDLLSLDAGRLPFSSLSMFDLQLLYRNNKLNLKRWDLFHIKNLNVSNTGLPHDGGFSWSVRTGVANVDLRCDDCLVAGTSGSLGKSYRLSNSAALYAMVNGKVQAPDRERRNFKAGVTAGLLSSLNPNWRMSLVVGYYYYRGYGQSVGKPDFMSVQKDALAGYQALLNERSDNRPIIVWGQSLGASIAINMVASLPFSERPQGLIIDSSFSSYQKIMQETLGKSWLTWLFQYPLSRLITPTYDPVQAISKIEQVPLLIVHSENDLLISSNHAEILFEKANDRKELWLSQQKGHIKIWNNKIWREKLSCQLTNWPVLQQFQQACLFDQKDLLESPVKEAYSKRIN